MKTDASWLCLGVMVCLTANAAPANAQASSKTRPQLGMSGLDWQRLGQHYSLAPPAFPLSEMSPPGTFTATAIGGPTFRAGQPIPLRLTVTNTFHTFLFLYYNDRYRSEYVYRVQRRVKSGALRDVSMTALGRYVFAPPPPFVGTGSVRGFGLSPGRRISECVHINSLFDMSAPGTYVICAVRTAVGLEEPGSPPGVLAMAAPPVKVNVLAASPKGKAPPEGQTKTPGLGAGVGRAALGPRRRAFALGSTGAQPRD
ncbi:MAG: hypothetical protein JO250_22060 [Armatimonadetes bacterium]|nr:hypothetical protein [Armatimonadota bacterium]